MTANYLWLQILGDPSGRAVEPQAIPAPAIADARTSLQRALATGPAGALISQRLHARLRAQAQDRRLLFTVLVDTAPLIDVAVAPRDRDGSKMWPALRDLAAERDLPFAERPPRAPWAIAMPSYTLRLFAQADRAWLDTLAAELACAWLAITQEERA